MTSRHLSPAAFLATRLPLLVAALGAGCGSSGGPATETAIVDGSEVAVTLSESRPLVGDVVKLQVTIDAQPVAIDWPDAIGPLRRVDAGLAEGATTGRYLVCDAAATRVELPPPPSQPDLKLPAVRVMGRSALRGSTELHPVRRSRLWPRWLQVGSFGLLLLAAVVLSGIALRRLVRRFRVPPLIDRLRRLSDSAIDGRTEHRTLVLEAATLVRDSLAILLDRPMAGATSRTFDQPLRDLEHVEPGLTRRVAAFLQTADTVRYAGVDATLADARDGMSLARTLIAAAADEPSGDGHATA